MGSRSHWTCTTSTDGGTTTAWRTFSSSVPTATPSRTRRDVVARDSAAPREHQPLSAVSWTAGTQRSRWLTGSAGDSNDCPYAGAGDATCSKTRPGRHGSLCPIPTELVLISALVVMVLTSLTAMNRAPVGGRDVGLIIGLVALVASLRLGYRMLVPPLAAACTTAVASTTRGPSVWSPGSGQRWRAP